MPFDYKTKIEQAFKHHIFSATDAHERQKEIVLMAIRVIVEKKESIIGFLRFQSADQKLVQFITQSLEIKTGDMLEEFFDELLAYKYDRMTKNITYAGKAYKCDQLVRSRDESHEIILIEQKIRDNHDSTKKDGQADNFENKIIALNHIYNETISAYEWFIDVQYRKYPAYYQRRIDDFMSHNPGLCNAHLIYGEEIIETLIGPGSWQLFVDAYNEVKTNFISDINHDLEYDFDADPDDIVFNYFKNKRKNSFDVFFSDDYSEIRNRFFFGGVMARRLNDYFSETSHRRSQTSIFFREKYNQIYGGN